MRGSRQHRTSANRFSGDADIGTSVVAEDRLDCFREPLPCRARRYRLQRTPERGPAPRSVEALDTRRRRHSNLAEPDHPREAMSRFPLSTWEGEQGDGRSSPNPHQPCVSQEHLGRATAPPPLEAAAPDCRGGRQSTRPRCLAREAESRVPVTVYRGTGRRGSRLQWRNRNKSLRGRVASLQEEGAVLPSQGVPVPDRGDRDQGRRPARPPGGKRKRRGRTVSRSRQRRKWPGDARQTRATFLAHGDAKRPCRRQAVCAEAGSVDLPLCGPRRESPGRTQTRSDSAAGDPHAAQIPGGAA
jgi:hypothetical protein